MHWNILDNPRKQILSDLGKVAEINDFYLAGGTALALQMGYRDSVDFDFFSQTDFDTSSLFSRFESAFKYHSVKKVQEDANTLTMVINEIVKVSYFTYGYELVKPLVKTDYFPLASVTDIGCMKLSAIVSRATMKDYIDLYFILHETSLSELLHFCKVKYERVDTGLILKSLVFFDDVEDEPILFKEGYVTDFETVKSYLKMQVKKIY